MTAKELLNPRCLVTSDYPDSPFKIGDIISIIWSKKENEV